jgi:hypothetical protein
VIASSCSGAPIVDTGGLGLDDGSLIGTPPYFPTAVDAGSAGLDARAQQQRKPHDLDKLRSSGYLERLGFKYRPATPATMYRHPSKLGMRP